MHLTAARVGVCALVAAVALAGCSGHGRHNASVASSFSQDSAVSSMPSAGQESSGPTPCQVGSPQIFVEGKHASSADGQVTFSYLDATRICSDDEHARYVTTGKSLTTKPVSPSAVVMLLAPGSAGELQVPPQALPAALASSKVGPPYYTITLDPAGTITRIEQAYLP